MFSCKLDNVQYSLERDADKIVFISWKYVEYLVYKLFYNNGA